MAATTLISPPIAATVGMGCYRVSDNNPAHLDALRCALDNGFSTFDTASTYTNGSSESALGTVLAGRSSTSTIITKVGIAEGHTLDLLRTYGVFGSPLPNSVAFTDKLAYSLHPDFLDDVLSSSLERLQRSFVDVLLLHNPEMMLQWAYQQTQSLMAARTGIRTEPVLDNHSEQRDAVDDVHTQSSATSTTTSNQELQDAIASARTTLDGQLALAMEWLERQVRLGRIKAYGVSSNTFASPPTFFDALSLRACLDIAISVGGSGHAFRYIQLPFNIIEHAPATQISASGLTLLEEAVQAGVHVVANRLLNAVVGTDLIRLVTHSTPLDAANPSALEDRIHKLEVEEHDVLQGIIKETSAKEHERDLLQETFRVAGALCQSWNRFEGIVHYRDARRMYLDSRLTVASRYPQAADYVANVTHVLDQLDALYAMEENASLEELRVALCEEAGARANTPLQHLAIHLPRNTPGIGTVLVGMRTSAYVSDVVRAASLPPITCDRTFWDRINDHLHRLSAS